MADNGADGRGECAERGNIFWFIALALGTFFLDQVAKMLALTQLSFREPIPLAGGVIWLNLTYNPGSAFGLITNSWAPMAMSGLVILVLALYGFLGGLKEREHKGMAIALGLVLGGAMGNFIDRVRFGAVVDFIDLRVWPVFNIADTAITVGVILLAFTIVRRR